MVIGRMVARFASSLRFPTLFKVVAGLFILDLFIPDPIPFYDEILLALGTVLLASMRKRGETLAPGRYDSTH